MTKTEDKDLCSKKQTEGPTQVLSRSFSFFSYPNTNQFIAWTAESEHTGNCPKVALKKKKKQCCQAYKSGPHQKYRVVSHLQMTRAVVTGDKHVMWTWYDITNIDMSRGLWHVRMDLPVVSRLPCSQFTSYRRVNTKSWNKESKAEWW